MTKCCCPKDAELTSIITCPAKREAVVYGLGSFLTMFGVFNLYYPEHAKKVLTIGAVGALTLGFLYLNSKESPVQQANFSNEDEFVGYKPFAFNIEQTKDFNINKIPSARIMLGDGENNLLVADSKGSQIWAKNGLNFIQANKGSDVFYFSLCSTKVINNQASVIDNFDINNDKLKFFCSKYHIQPEDINIRHINYQEGTSTCIEVKGASDTSVVCLNGNIDLNPEDIIITTLGEVSSELGII